MGRRLARYRFPMIRVTETAHWKSWMLRRNTGVIGWFAMSLFLWLDGRGWRISGNMRLLLDLFQSANPLRRSANPPEISIVVPFVRKDLDTLPYCVWGAVSSSMNPVRRVTLVTPARTIAESGLALDDIEAIARSLFSAEFESLEILVRLDEDVLGKALSRQIADRGLSPRYRGWCTQQLVKVLAAMQEETAGALVVDSDTVLYFPRVWVDSHRKQLLLIGQECREVPFDHSNSFLGIHSRPMLSFVTHHQLWQPAILKEIFPRGEVSVAEWLAYADPKEPEDQRGFKLNDYETYGAYLSSTHPEKVSFATWGNETGSRDALEVRPSGRKKRSVPLSVSYHHYLSASISDPGMF